MRGDGTRRGAEKPLRRGDRPGKHRNGRCVVRAAAAVRLDGGLEVASGRARVQRARADAASKRRVIPFRPAR